MVERKGGTYPPARHLALPGLPATAARYPKTTGNHPDLLSPKMSSPHPSPKAAVVLGVKGREDLKGGSGRIGRQGREGLTWN